MKHLIKVALVLLAAVAAYYVYGFTSLVADEWIAYGAAGSLVGTYVGLAFADIPDRQTRRAQIVAQGAMVIEAVYGTLYVLHVQSPELFRAPLPIWASVALAVLHGASFSVLAFFVSLFVVHAGIDAKQMPTQADAMLSIMQALIASMPAQPQPPTPIESREHTALIESKTFPCPECEFPLTGPEYGAAQRWGGCKQCRNVKQA